MPRARGAASPTSPRVVNARQRQDQALVLRAQGATFDQIAVQLGYSGKDSAHRAVTAALRRHAAAHRETAEQLRIVESLRIDNLLAVVQPAAANGDLAAVDRALRLSESLRRLHGLDAERRVIEVITNDVIDRAIAMCESELCAAGHDPDALDDEGEDL